jgi:ABC-type sugar transport system substrate-binding protein
MSRAHAWALLAAVALSVSVAACGSGDGGGASGGGSKLIVATMGFPCSLNDFSKSLCDGFRAGESALPDGYRFELKTGTDYADQTAYNNLIQTSMQLNPAGMIVFPGGPAAQVPLLKQACAKDVKIIILDNPVPGLGDCRSSYIAANNRTLGANLGTWLSDHAPASTEVGIVSFPPGQDTSMDDRVKGFTDTVEAAGFKVVATVPTDLSLDKTRTQVTNMLTAHPGLGAIFSAADQLGYGTAQAVAHSGGQRVLQLTIDGALDAVKRIPEGLAADAAQHPYFAGKQSVLTMVKALQGQSVPAFIPEPTKLIDETNADAYIAAGGLK